MRARGIPGDVQDSVDVIVSGSTAILHGISITGKGVEDPMSVESPVEFLGYLKPKEQRLVVPLFSEFSSRVHQIPMRPGGPIPLLGYGYGCVGDCAPEFFAALQDVVCLENPWSDWSKKVRAVWMCSSTVISRVVMQNTYLEVGLKYRVQV